MKKIPPNSKTPHRLEGGAGSLGRVNLSGSCFGLIGLYNISGGCTKPFPGGVCYECT